ncbi:Huntingtin [Eumeta japonica]|uniref:Huntingtin n=1 Tax=Eumeta variegata TaxID=151549 RepID=A0A4C1XIG3_EUMVA|nr:Huntingtin [Eumeta japonica]
MLTSDKLLTLIEYWEMNFYSRNLSKYDNILAESYKIPIENLLVSLSRLDLVCKVALIPPIAWSSVDLSSQKDYTEKIDIPLQALQDMDVLEAFLFRVNFVGWSTKKVFEEIWVGLLGALQGNGTHWAVRGIMQLLISTIPKIRKNYGATLMHVPRKYEEVTSGMQKLRNILVGTHLYEKLFDNTNFERIPFGEDGALQYHYGQFNTEFLRLASEITEDETFRVRLHLKRIKKSTDIDVNSCLQLLMDVASQMLLPKAPTGLSARCTLLSCIITTSDLFTEIGQWCWLAQQLIALTTAEYKLVTQYSIASQYLLYGLSKCLSILEGFEGLSELSTVHQKLLKSLASSYAPLRQAALQGCLLQLCGKARHIASIHTPNPYQELVSQLDTTVRQYLSQQSRISLYEQSLYWTVLFTLVEMGHSDLITIAVDFLLNNPDHFCSDLIVKGITTTIRLQILPKELKNAMIEKLITNMKNYKESHALQILMVHLFTADDKLLSPKVASDVSNMDPDVLMNSMERVTLLYKALREASCAESMTVITETMKYFLRETLPPAATLSRVVIEFVETCRETERVEAGLLTDKTRWILCSVLNADIVFEVFETSIAQDQLPVLSGWIFEALNHLLNEKISGDLLPYCLTSLLVSASTNPFIRDLAPITMTILRLGLFLCSQKTKMAESLQFSDSESVNMFFTDRRLLCMVTLHSNFNKHQLEKLIELCEGDDKFSDLMKCLTAVQD